MVKLACKGGTDIALVLLLLLQEMGCLTAAQVDHVFHKIKPHTRSKVNFVQFMEGLRHISMHHRISLNEVIERIVVVGGPNRLSSDSNQ